MAMTNSVQPFRKFIISKKKTIKNWQHANFGMGEGDLTGGFKIFVRTADQAIAFISAWHYVHWAFNITFSIVASYLLFSWFVYSWNRPMRGEQTEPTNRGRAAEELCRGRLFHFLGKIGNTVKRGLFKVSRVKWEFNISIYKDPTNSMRYKQLF